MRRKWLAAAGVLVVVSGALVIAWPDGVDAVPVDGTFVDDNLSVHENGIEAVALAGISVGCNPPNNNRFCPTRNVTRAEAATFLARALTLSGDGVDYFGDDNGHVLEGGINKLAAAGITQGCNPPANNRFCPDRNLTRAEFAAFISRGLGLESSPTNHFVDDNGHVLEASINRIADAGITVGCNPPTNDRFCPQRLLTRGETATLLTRALHLPHNPQRIPLSNWSPIRCGRDGKTCVVTIEITGGKSYFIEEGLFHSLPYRSGEQAQFMASGTNFALTLNGSAVSTTQLSVATTASQALRRWNTPIVLPDGNHVLVGEWRWNGTVVQRTTASVSAG